MGKHEYSDNCLCAECQAAWDKALFEALDRGDAKRKAEQAKNGKA